MTPLAAALVLTLAAAAGSTPATAPAAAAAPGPAAGLGGLPFVADDYAAALADARSRGVPLVVDAWAPW